MRINFLFLSCFIVFALLGTACGGKAAAAEAGSDTDSVAVEDLAGLVDALGTVGATIEQAEAVEQVFFTVPGQIVRVNGTDVQVFEYETAEAMQADAAQVSDDGGSIGTSMVTWVAPPHFYKAGHILVLYIGDDQVILDLLEGALGPQFAGR